MSPTPNLSMQRTAQSAAADEVSVSKTFAMMSISGRQVLIPIYNK